MFVYFYVVSFCIMMLLSFNVCLIIFGSVVLGYY
jgi:hypothetical protein